jgi:hypothetical protein
MKFEPFPKPKGDPFQSDMIENLFSNINVDGCLLGDMLDYLIESYHFVNLRYRSNYDEKELRKKVSRNISSLLNAYYKEAHLIPRRNFDRKMTEAGYVYWSLPKTSDLVLKPQSSPQSSAQLALDYDTKDEPETDEFVEDEPDTSEDEETTSEETTMRENCPLLDDILASDKINDPIQRIIDNYSNIDLFGIDQVQFTATKSGKKITITIANA